MNVKLSDNITITTEHPASHYGLGVCLIDGQAYGPSENFPVSQEVVRVFGDVEPFSAAQIVVMRCYDRIMTDPEISQVRRWLSQHPEPSREELLPPDLEVRQRQIKSEYKNEVGDDSQGIAPCYYQQAYANVAVKLYQATGGKMSLPLLAYHQNYDFTPTEEEE